VDFTDLNALDQAEVVMTLEHNGVLRESFFFEKKNRKIFAYQV
jgi:hypothetical protein